MQYGDAELEDELDELEPLIELPGPLWEPNDELWLDSLLLVDCDDDADSLDELELLVLDDAGGGGGGGALPELADDDSAELAEALLAAELAEDTLLWLAGVDSPEELALAEAELLAEVELLTLDDVAELGELELVDRLLLADGELDESDTLELFEALGDTERLLEDSD